MRSKAKQKIAHYSAFREYLVSAFKLMVLRNSFKTQIAKINENIKDLTEKLLSADTKNKINLESKIDNIINFVESNYNESKRQINTGPLSAVISSFKFQGNMASHSCSLLINGTLEKT